jgi:hypothetical protein
MTLTVGLNRAHRGCSLAAGPRRGGRAICATLCVLSSLIALSASPAGAGTLQLSNNSFDDDRPQINSAGQVVWQGWDGNDWEIFFWSGSSVQQLTHNDRNDINPRINANGKVVWQGWNGLAWQIYYWDSSTVQTLSASWVDSVNPKINSANPPSVVWEGMPISGGGGTPSWEIWLWNGISAQQLTTDAEDDTNPHLDETSPAQTVWQHWDGKDWEIYFWVTVQVGRSQRPTS